MMIMKTLIKKEELQGFTSNVPFFSESLCDVLMSVLKLNRINEVYSNSYTNDPLVFIESVFFELKIKISFNQEELENIPLEGAFITVSNHPYGGIDGLILLYLLLKKRPDFKVMANFLLKRILPISDKVLAVNPFDNVNVSSYVGVKESLMHLKKGYPLGVFPAGEVSTFNKDSKTITDKVWNPNIIKLIKKVEVPILPIYFEGNNSLMFHLFGLINPKLRSAKLPSELLNKKNKEIKVVIGKPISLKDQQQIENIAQFGRYIRTRTYALDTNFKVKKFFHTQALNFPQKPQQIVEETPKLSILNEIIELRNQYQLFEINNFEAFCAPAFKIPNILNEIGRHREITFRKIGEGTNKSVDLDEYDVYYHHLFLWDKTNEKLVGSYRIGAGAEIMSSYGRKGFYLNSLFKLKEEFYPILNQSLELGRSFIVEDYQQKLLPLFLLWKGILYYLIKNKQYRYLIGPVSISNEYSTFSKQLIIEFIKSNYYDYKLSRYIKPRHQFTPVLKDIDLSTILNLTKDDISKLDKYVKDIDQRNMPVPILLKKYLKQNAKIIGFNLDPKFNNCLDGFMVLDLCDVPEDVIYSLSDEIQDKELVSFLKQRK